MFTSKGILMMRAGLVLVLFFVFLFLGVLFALRLLSAE